MQSLIGRSQAWTVSLGQASGVELISAFQLGPFRAVVLGCLLALGLISGAVHWAVVARVSRLRSRSMNERLLPYGFGVWHLGVLRRSWYPSEAKHLYLWGLASYVTAIVALLGTGALLVAWFVI